MGYCIRVRNVKFAIKEANKRPALKAIRALKGKETCKDSSGSHFSWVCAQDFNSAGTLEDMLRVWRWHPTTDPETGDITNISFTGEKFGDDDVFFTALAPFIEAGSEMTFMGEDGEAWKYKFDGKTMKEVKQKRVWEDEE